MLAPEGGGAGPTYEMRVGRVLGSGQGGELGVCSPLVVLCAGITGRTLPLLPAPQKWQFDFGLFLIFLFIIWANCPRGEGNGDPLQYSCLENPMEGGGAWWAAVSEVTKSRPRLSDFTFITFMHWRRKWQPTPVLPGESQGWRSLVGCCLWGHTESDTTEAI